VVSEVMGTPWRARRGSPPSYKRNGARPGPLFGLEADLLDEARPGLALLADELDRALRRARALDQAPAHGGEVLVVLRALQDARRDAVDALRELRRHSARAHQHDEARLLEVGVEAVEQRQ